MSQFRQIIYPAGLLLLVLFGVYIIFRKKEPFQDMLNEVEQTSNVSPRMSEKENTQPSNLVVPEIAVSGNAYDAMSLQQRSQLLRDIQQVVKNEILSQRQMQPLPQNEGDIKTNSTQQGQEYKTSTMCPSNSDGSCPPVPDMSQYIRKDQIPCWNCTLDY